MLGIGTWECKIDTVFFKGTAQLKVFDNKGEYGFDLTVPGMEVPDIKVISVEEDDTFLDAVVHTSLTGDKDINVSVEFDGDIVTGFVKVPYLGKIKLKDGHRIA